ncbi:MAG TPA: ABC transporter substrate-binding protein [Gemmatimonadaceae bacterium]|jgi:branched-chain amino acid transport system substrate-binding protein|nr:ABC transporter substrate-binding protein [Gemmatimonadaceae bacterium]
MRSNHRSDVTRHSSRTPSPLILLGALAIGLGCAGSTDDGGPIRIGIAADLKRPNMQSVFRGVELAVEQLNAEASGRTFEIGKPPSEATGAVEIAAALRDDPRVVAVVGPADSRSSREAAPIFSDDDGGGQRALAAVSPTSTSIALTGISPWMFRVCPSDAASSRAAARYVLDSLGFRRATIMYRNDSYGRGWSSAFSQAFAAGGGTVLERNPHIADMNEWRAYAGVVKLTRPEIILFPGSPADLAGLAGSLRAIGAETPVLGGDAISELEARAAEFAGVRYIAFFQASRVRTPEAKAFVSAFTKKYGVAPEQRSALAYDATMIIARAALEVGADRARIRDFLASIGTSRPAMTGVTGPIAFDEQNDPVNKPVVIATVGQ